MQIIISESVEDFHKEAAAYVSRQVLQKPDSLIGFATGDTTVGIHKWVIRYHKETGVDYSRCKVCVLDEYAGIAADDPRGCCWRINDGLFNHLNLSPENIYIPDGLSDPPEKELDVFKKAIDNFGGIDLQVLSVGQNGHIAFNEPGTPFDSSYRMAPISPNTVKAKAGLFGGEDKVPRFGISMGIRDIMMARKILLVASGTHKSEVIRQVVNGTVTEDVPATVVRLHPNVVVVIDKPAASKL